MMGQVIKSFKTRSFYQTIMSHIKQISDHFKLLNTLCFMYILIYQFIQKTEQ